VTVSPKVSPRQRAVLLLNEFGAVSDTPQAYSFDARPRSADRYTLRFRIRRVLPGDYLVRVQVDGAESPLVVDPDPNSPTFEQYFEPTVTI